MRGLSRTRAQIVKPSAPGSTSAWNERPPPSGAGAGARSPAGGEARLPAQFGDPEPGVPLQLIRRSRSPSGSKVGDTERIPPLDITVGSSPRSAQISLPAGEPESLRCSAAGGMIGRIRVRGMLDRSPGGRPPTRRCRLRDRDLDCTGIQEPSGLVDNRGCRILRSMTASHRSDQDLDLDIRLWIYRHLAEHGSAPSALDIAESFSIEPPEVDDSLLRLAKEHDALVLVPGTTSIWMAEPFSAVPTWFRVHGADDRRWWGNCIWDGLGILGLLGVDGSVETRCPDCGWPIRVQIQNGGLQDATGVVHFAVRAARWWRDIGFT